MSGSACPALFGAVLILVYSEVMFEALFCVLW